MKSNEKRRLLSGRFRLIAVILLLTIFGSACTVRYIAPYDEKTKEAVFSTYKMVDSFYGELLDTAEEERKYEDFSRNYIAVASELKLLLLRNKVRKLNEDSTDISERILKLWLKIKARHKERGAYSTGAAKLDRKRFERMFAYAVRAEDVKKPNDKGE